ncbi:MAG: tannase/feruloyl esterase family alpha/beta hydrolase, partial [Nevskia sp.]|nr:tannase/feruloyl esterase family alpha/beta hydrolase [Nevskia sp.]
MPPIRMPGIPASLRLPLLAGVAALWLPGAAIAAAPQDCAAMVGVTVPASAIALPTGGVRITGAKSFAATGEGAKAVGAFCRVNAEILPRDPAAPPIKMEVNLPEQWNGNALMFGGGGYNGSILSTGGTLRLQPTDMPIPLARGYATFGGDSGHAGTSADASFATNPEALRNYALDGVKKTRDAAVYLIKARYARPAEKLYFHGSSNGGKEAMGMIQRYPNDLDGAMVFWPAVYIGTEAVQMARVARAFDAPGAWPNLAKRQRLLAAELETCDALDGAQDGVISNPRACEAKFDPVTAKVAGQPLRCPSGADEGD